jgi:predicted nucleotide-binding protein (sugar kinase/HSP70/actin superfamily)
VAALAARLSPPRGGRRVALSDAFQLKGFFPFFATYLHELGLDLEVADGGGRAALRRGIEGANVPFCAPMQQHHGALASLAERRADFLFVPSIREIQRVGPERTAQLCPIVQASPDVLAWDLGSARGRMLSPVIDVGPGPLDAPVFRESCRRLAAEIGVRRDRAWRAAFERAREEQLAFDARLLEGGREALAFCARTGVVPVVVLGRTYTIHDDVLNSNVPAILRDQGAVAIPLDCFPVSDDAPVFDNMYWGHGQRILRAAWQIRRTPEVYALFASNYSCGPDSFTHHLVQDLMEGKPFAVIETDGHAGDAGTKTRVEAFLHCVREHRTGGERSPPREAERLTVHSATISDIRAAGETVLFPTLGDGAHVLAAAMRGIGLAAEVLPDPGPEALRLGRRHTSGKECLPMTLTLGALLERLERERGREGRFAFFMPGTDGPCRFGAYKELHQLVLDRLAWRDRVRIWAPPFGDYFQGLPPGLGAIVLAAAVATDVLRDMLYDVRPRETRRGEALATYRRALAELVALVEREARGDLSGRRVLREAATGRAWGVPALLARTGAEMAALRGESDLPLVLVVGEIYVRNVPFANGFVVDELERRGIRAKVAAVSEFIQYSDFVGARLRRRSLGERVDSWVRNRLEVFCHAAGSRAMGWPVPPHVREVVGAARPWVRETLEGETVLTVGAAVHAWRRGEVDAVLSVGPLECMPNKLAETQLVHVGETEKLLSLTLSLNGDPLDPEPLDAFALEVHARHAGRRASGALAPSRPKHGLGALPPLEPEGA